MLVAVAAMTALAVAVPSSAWALDTAGTVHTGSIPTAAGSTGGAGSGGPGAVAGSAAGGRPGAGFGPRTGGAPPSGSGRLGTPPGGSAGPTTGGAALGGGAGTLSTSSALVTALEQTTARWAAATVGSQEAAALELASGGTAVMAIGGFSGTDNAPSLAQFKAYVAAGDIRYFIAGGQAGGFGGPGGGSGSGSDVGSQITSWVEAHYTSTTIGGQTVYDLQSPS